MMAQNARKSNNTMIDANQANQAIADSIDQLLPRDHAIPEVALLYQMMRDYPNRGGKRLRGRLLLASALAHGASTPAQLRNATSLAAALELFQNWILIHDDIEDGSEERRGQPALHRLHPMPLALNAGDALHIYMWQAVHQAQTPGAFEEFLETIHLTAEGQHMDLGWVLFDRWDMSEADYLEMVRRKTARYTVVAPLRLGAMAAGIATPDPRLMQAGLELGIAFQVRDDVLNLAGDFANYGKEIAGDLWEGKRTLMLVRLLALASASERALVLRLMQQTRADKQTSQINAILALIKQYGCLDYAQAIAATHAERGLALLGEVLAALPNQPAAQAILHEVRSLATRSS
jgi:geranylgeranyl diphosphate synthase, type II